MQFTKEDLAQLRTQLQCIVGNINAVIPILWELHMKISGIEKEFDKLNIFCNPLTTSESLPAGTAVPEVSTVTELLKKDISTANVTLEGLIAAGIIKMPKKETLKKTESLTSVLEKNLELNLKKE
jgi:hypothetical protein